MKRLISVVALGIVLAQCNMKDEAKKEQLPDGVKLIERIEQKEGELSIPYEKYVFDNGLTLLIHEDHSDPVVHVDVTYHVGSAREEVSKSGFAHFFEHMMFQGSDNVADEQHFKIVSEAGGDLNGTTNTDRTNYFETLPSNYLERALWLEADRMGFLLDAVTQEKFEIQRATVKNERGQRYDNRPYGLVHEKIGEHLYPFGHPYSWSTIGYVEDLNRVDVTDLKKFFLRWYGPNNAVLTVGGDVDPSEVISLANKYFGSIPRGPEVKNMDKVPAKLEADRYVSYEDQYIRFPMYRMVIPTVHVFHEDEAPLDVLSDILGGGKSSLLYKNLVKNQKALQASAIHPARELAAEFIFTVIPSPGVTLAEAEQIVRETIEEFEERGVTDDDLQRTKGSMEARMINGLATVSGKVSQLASYYTFLGDANYIQKDISRYNNVTKEDVMRVFKKYIKGQHSLSLSVYPKGQQELIAKEDNYSKPTGDDYIAPADEYADLTYNKAQDNFDRSVMPPAGANPAIKVPELWRAEINGIKVIGAQNSEIPTVTLQLSIEGGHKLENKTNIGIAQLTASVMNESTENYTTEEMSNQLAKLGSNISVHSSDDNVSIYVSSLVKNLDATLALMEERLLKPKFSEEDFERKKEQQLKAIVNQSTQPSTIARYGFRKVLYGNENILSSSELGTAETVGAITLDQVKSFYTDYLAPNLADLVIVGDIKQNEILAKLDFLKSWEQKEVDMPELPPAPKRDKVQVFLIDQPGSAQSEIRIGKVELPYDATGDYYKANLMNFNLGGAFNSRINLNLREDKGYTYGARSSFSGNNRPGPFFASAGVKKDATDSSVIEFMKEIVNFKENGITDDEVTFLKNSIGQSKALSYEAPSSKAAFLRRIIQYNLDEKFVDEQEEILKNITKEEINELAQKYLNPDKFAILVVGDKATIKERLESLGYGDIIELDKSGNVMKAVKANSIEM